ncbi:MAG: lamin tail domain-containing protein, partial [Planctomycetota bacterium]
GPGETSHTDPDPGRGQVIYAVLAVLLPGPGEEPPGDWTHPATCTLDVLMAPVIVSCGRLDPENPSPVRIEWQSGAAYDSYEIDRDGAFIASVLGAPLIYEDDTVSDSSDGHLYEIFGVAAGIRSVPAECLVDDLDAGEGIVAPPTSATAIVVGGTTDVRLQWTNGENYDSVEIDRDGAVIVFLPGGSTEIHDLNRPPAIYTYHVRGIIEGITSIPTATVPPEVMVELVPPHTLLCDWLGGTHVSLTWVNGFTPETGGSIEVIRDGVSPPIATLPGDAVAYTDLMAPPGDYSYTVQAVFGGSSSESQPCNVSINSEVRVLDLLTAIGFPENLIEIDADLLADLEGFEIVLRFDAASFSFASVQVPGVDPAYVEVTEQLGEGEVEITLTIDVDIPVGEAPISAQGGSPLVQILGAIPEDISIVGSTALELDFVQLDYGAGSEIVAGTGGTLEIKGKALQMLDRTVLPGQSFTVKVFATYDEAIQGLQLALGFDPEVLTCLQITNENSFTSVEFDYDLTGSFDNIEGIIRAGIACLGGACEDLPATFQPSEDPLQFMCELEFLVNPDAAFQQTSLTFLNDPEATPPLENLMVVVGASSVTDILEVSATISVDAPPDFSGLVLNELQSANVGEIADEAGDLDPWIELYNGSSQVYPLSGTVLSHVSDSGNSAQWALPSGTLLAPGEFLLIWAVGEEGEGALHTNFTLDSAGGHLLLLNIDGESIVDQAMANYPALGFNGSFGRLTDGGPLLSTLALPTPGSSNTPQPRFIRGDTNNDFSLDVGDVVMLQEFLHGGAELTCLDAADVNDDGAVDDLDVVSLLAIIAGGSVTNPGGDTHPPCGEDETGDGLGCDFHPCLQP